ncbi:MAG TPA: hypothetical protein VGQ19_14450 [Burkholderiales bacterium]|nr:hypothetical protein [Burkholderiales bacterium]
MPAAVRLPGTIKPSPSELALYGFGRHFIDRFSLALRFLRHALVEIGGNDDGFGRHGRDLVVYRPV